MFSLSEKTGYFAQQNLSSKLSGVLQFDEPLSFDS